MSYREDQMTPWFPAAMTPKRRGVYEREDDKRTYRFSYWNGYQWCISGRTIGEALETMGDAGSCKQDLEWRGLNFNPEAQ